MHARDDQDSPQAKLRYPKDRACSPYERHGNHRVHSRRRTQLAGTLGRFGPRWPREGHRTPLHHRARQARHDGHRKAPSRPLALWSEKAESSEIVRYYSPQVIFMRRPVKNRIQPGPDNVYGSVKVSKLINYVMERGKKDTATKIVYKVMEEL